MPHGMCFLWRPELIWLHAVSDGVIAPVLLFDSVRPDLFPHAAAGPRLSRACSCLFAAFILACGTTHLMGIWTLWHPDYWVDGGIKLVTATVSMVTAVLLWRLMPDALALPSRAQLETAEPGPGAADRRTVAGRGERARLNLELERAGARAHRGARGHQCPTARGTGGEGGAAPRDPASGEEQSAGGLEPDVVAGAQGARGAQAVLQESLERIGAMGRVHEQLYRSDDASIFRGARA